MVIASLTWPQAVVAATSIAALGLVLTVLVWSIFRTGQTAISHESGERRQVESLRAEVAALCAQLEPSGRSTAAHPDPSS
jgi:cytochrome c-type biogenesis protein CcmH/NrfG